VDGGFWKELVQLSARSGGHFVHAVCDGRIFGRVCAGAEAFFFTVFTRALRSLLQLISPGATGLKQAETYSVTPWLLTWNWRLALRSWPKDSNHLRPAHQFPR